MRKIICVVGSTAVGKTALSVQIAQKHNGFLLSVDSIQVYQKLDIISGKDKDVAGNIPLKLVDLVSPFAPYSVSDYVLDFNKELCIDLQKLPIVVGGTGFYVHAILNGIETVDTPPDSMLRQKLSAMTVGDLQNKLQEINPLKFEKMNQSDRNNPRRLMRAIELGKNIPSSATGLISNNEVLTIGLTCEREVLNKRIDKRVDERVKQGALKEAEGLLEDYEDLAPQIKHASGYKQLFEYLQGKYSLEEAIEKWKTAEHQNAKKQMTWFKKQKNIEWFDTENADFEAQILQKVDEFLEN